MKIATVETRGNRVAAAHCRAAQRQKGARLIAQSIETAIDLAGENLSVEDLLERYSLPYGSAGLRECAKNFAAELSAQRGMYA